MFLSGLVRAYQRFQGKQIPAGFDADWYRRYYPDVAAAGADPVTHYLKFGRDEGRLPFCPPLFDAEWYRRQYPDARELDDPLGHYWHSGAREGRDPGPDFSTSGYVLRYPQASEAINPLTHFMEDGCEQGLEPLPELEGSQVFKSGHPVIVVAGHQAGQQLYGAERSLLDMLAGLSGLEVNLIVTLPSAVNAAYVEAVRAHAWRLAIIPYGWWRAGQSPVSATQAHFTRLLQQYQADALYANTLVLDEPLLAARALQVPVIVHVRELPAYDEALCQSLGANAPEIIARLTDLADHVVTNSAFTAQSLGIENALVVPNTLELSDYEGLSTPAERNEPLTVAMISSNLPKKGLLDFVELARALHAAADGTRCLLVGPENAHIQSLREQQMAGELPNNLAFADYAETPQEALTQADIVVNLSHFKESFGRTVLEAMAAARPVVAYRWGALPELVEDGATGYLVPLGDVQAVAERVHELILDADLRRRLGQRARERAHSYTPQVARESLYKVLQRIN